MVSREMPEQGGKYSKRVKRIPVSRLDRQRVRGRGHERVR